MKLLPLDSSERIRQAALWLSAKENYQWLDFGSGRQIMTPEWLKIASQRPTDVIRLFTMPDDTTPIGVVGLSEVDRLFGTARVWSLAGDKSFRARGHTTFAVSRLLTYAFSELGLRSVNTWIVERNPSVRMAERLGMRPIGRQRQCHLIDGRVCDRLWFDLLASEHRELEDVRYARRA